MIDVRRHIVPAMFAVFIVAPMMWWLMDREPPYVREAGAVAAASPKDCGLPDTTPVGLVAGGCVAVNWRITSKRICKPYGQFNVHRSIIDSRGEQRSLPATSDPHYDLMRFFAIPTNMPIGPAQYVSTACFACNPLQHLVLPVCVEKPSVAFTVEEPR